jgi:hypothetical protein
MKSALLMLADRFTSRAEAADVLETYLRLHRSKLGSYWIWCALSRIASGEEEAKVMGDYGWTYEAANRSKTSKSSRGRK